MKNNLAELRSIDIDKSILTAEWEKLFAMHPDYKWIGRNFVDLDFFTPYFKKLILSIEQALGEVPTNLTIQVHAPSKNVPGKAYLTIPHTDYPLFLYQLHIIKWSLYYFMMLSHISYLK
jgi:hypothetical protein